MPVLVSREVEEASQDIVSIVNVGERTLKFRFNGRPYVFPGKGPKYPNGSIMHVPAGRAWVWFGNPAERDNPKAWNNETRALANRHGQDIWEYLNKGLAYVREWVGEFGLGEAFYGGAEPDESEMEVTAAPIDEDFVLNGVPMEVALRAIDDQPVSALNLLSENVQTKGVARVAKTSGALPSDQQDVAIARAAGMAELAAGKHKQ